MSVLATATAPVTVNRSKVERPLLTGRWVRRPGIEARLDHALTRSLFVIAAPAGHGKTSSIISWLYLRDLVAAWVTVDDRDDDLTRFATHVAVALDSVTPGIALVLFNLLTIPDRLAPADLGEAFGEALYELERDVVLVLDDLHAAGSSAVVAFVAGLLQAAPRRLHTILSMRGKPPFPLSRLRTKGDVEELTGADLRFSPQETSELLRLETGELVDPKVATRVRASVGGWPAAIRLIAISRNPNEAMQSPEATPDNQAHLLLDYLGEEVLARLPPPQRDLLLRASLVERFNAPLLDALSEHQGHGRLSRADLERLRALELFREIPGLAETWFAYHPLFRDVFLRELEHTEDAHVINDLHRSVADWFAEVGLTQEAVHHLLAVDDLSAAATLIESRLSEAFAWEDWQSVASWLRLIPMEEIRESPELLLASAWVAYLSGRDARVAEVLAAMRDARIRRKATDAQRAEITLLAEPANSDPNTWITSAERAIALIPAHKRYQFGYAHLSLGTALTSVGRAEEALARLAAFTDRESAHIDAASIRGYFGRAFVLLQAGQLTRCDQAAADLLQLAGVNGLPLAAGWGSLILGWIAHERGDLVEATRRLAGVIADTDRLHFRCVCEAFLVQILVFEAQGLRDEADRAVARLREFAMTSENRLHLERVDAFVARIALIRGNLVTAQRWLETSPRTRVQDDLRSIHNADLTRIQVLVALGTHEALAEADRILTAFVSEARATHMTLAHIEGMAVQALLYETQGDHSRADRALRESLALAAPERIVQRYAYLGAALTPILRRVLGGAPPIPYAQAVLNTLDMVFAAQPGLSQSSGRSTQDIPHRSLSEREQQVLQCLSLRLTNNEIGDELYISPITVKNHIAHISEKLGVSGRRAAVQRASELGLLPAGA